MGLKAKLNFEHDGVEFAKGQDLTQEQAEELGKDAVKLLIEKDLLEVTEKESKKGKGKKKDDEGGEQPPEDPPKE